MRSPRLTGLPRISVRSPARSSTNPQGSWPVTIGKESPSLSGPCQRCTSVPHRVDAVIFTSREPGSSLGIGTCWMVSGLLCSVMTAARHVSIFVPLDGFRFFRRLEQFERLNNLNYQLLSERQFVKRLRVAPQHRRLVLVGDLVAFH